MNKYRIKQIGHSSYNIQQRILLIFWHTYMWNYGSLEKAKTVIDKWIENETNYPKYFDHPPIEPRKGPSL